MRNDAPRPAVEPQGSILTLLLGPHRHLCGQATALRRSERPGRNHPLPIVVDPHYRFLMPPLSTAVDCPLSTGVVYGWRINVSEPARNVAKRHSRSCNVPGPGCSRPPVGDGHGLCGVAALAPQTPGPCCMVHPGSHHGASTSLHDPATPNQRRPPSWHGAR
jgi:hypothetical protein